MGKKISKKNLDPFNQLLYLNLQVRIYYGSFEVTKIKETPQFTSQTILSEFGGTLSLWLGICLAGVLELVELSLRVVAVFFTSIRRKITTDKKKTDHQK